MGNAPEDHPRLRGEHSTNEVGDTLTVGSPPPTRGTPRLDRLEKAIDRITPAYAGNTTENREDKQLIGDHPRLRGEHAV